jgi:transposase-like protein
MQALLTAFEPRDCRQENSPPMPCSSPAVHFAGFRFPSDVIVVVVRWYARFGLSYRDFEELLIEGLVEVGHVTIDR